MFEETVNQFIQWGVGIGLLYWCYRNATFRIFGFVFGGIFIIAALVRDFITMPGLDNGKTWAIGLVMLCVCLFGHFASRE